MSLDWVSNTTEIFLNPRISSEKRGDYIARLQKYPLHRHIWVATSGTTGQFKFVALSKDAFLASAAGVNAYFNIDASDVWLHTLPDFHVAGIAIWARCYLSGAQVVKEHFRWDPIDYVDLANKTGATLTSLVPAQVYDLVTHQLRSPPTLRAVIVGGGVLAQPVYDRARELGWNLFPSYGLTECASIVAVGKNITTILPHLRVKIDTHGYICLKGESLLTAYGILEEETFRFIDPKENGWLTTEDRGELIGQQLRVFGRAGDFVKILGESVNLLYLQNMLDECKFQLEIVRDAVIIPIPHPRQGAFVHLAVEGCAPCSKISKKLVEAYNCRVMPYETIHRVHYLEKIPRSPLGKLRKGDLLSSIKDNKK